MDEMEKYRKYIYQKYKSRRTGFRKYNGGKRIKDRTPSFWGVGIIVQFITLILFGLLILFCTACAYVKITVLGY